MGLATLAAYVDPLWVGPRWLEEEFADLPANVEIVRREGGHLEELDFATMTTYADNRHEQSETLDPTTGGG